MQQQEMAKQYQPCPFPPSNFSGASVLAQYSPGPDLLTPSPSGLFSFVSLSSPDQTTGRWTVEPMNYFDDNKSQISIWGVNGINEGGLILFNGSPLGALVQQAPAPTRISF